MKEKKKTEEDLEKRLLDVGGVTESADDVIDRLLDESDKKKRRYATG